MGFTNVTFSGNSATLGGAMLLFGNGGTLLNCTFADNHADFGSEYFGAAIGGGTAARRARWRRVEMSSRSGDTRLSHAR